MLPSAANSVITFAPSDRDETGSDVPPPPLRRVGSLLPLARFEQWCRSYAAWVLTLDYGPTLAFADGLDFAEPYGQTWMIDGEPYPSVEACLADVVPSWVERSGASQVGVTVPLGDANDPGLLLLVVDEGGIRAAKAPVSLAGTQAFVGDWVELAPPSTLPVAEWQGLLAGNARLTTSPAGEPA